MFVRSSRKVDREVYSSWLWVDIDVIHIAAAKERPPGPKNYRGELADPVQIPNDQLYPICSIVQVVKHVNLSLIPSWMTIAHRQH